MIRSPSAQGMAAFASEVMISPSPDGTKCSRSNQQLSAAESRPADVILLQMISFQGWLSRFSDSYIRGSFLSGKFSVSDNNDKMLLSIDKIREVMLPTPSLGSEACANVALAGSVFFNKFVSKDLSEPVDVDGCFFPVRKSYHDWYVYLGDLSVSKFWSAQYGTEKVVSSPIRNVSAVKPCEEPGFGLARSRHFTCDKPRQRDGFLGLEEEPQHSRQADGSWFPANDGWRYNRREVSRDRSVSPKPRRPFHKDCLRRHDRDISRKFEELSLKPKTEQGQIRNMWSPVRSAIGVGCYSRGQETEYDRRHHSPPSASDSDRDYCRDVPQRGGAGSPYAGDGELYRLLNQMKHPREAVSPEVFSGEEGASLREFLEDYEVFFATKYDGNEKQQARVLGQYLDGPTKRAYEAMEGAKLRYSSLKVELLHWYKGERISMRNRSDNEFRRAKMVRGDTLRIYALRLERLASRAFPESVSACERQLCRKFWKSVPDSFHKILSNSEKSLALHGEARKLDWSEMVRLAESEDRYKRDRREEISSESEAEPDLGIWYSRPSSRPQTCQRGAGNQGTSGNRTRTDARVTFKDEYKDSNLKTNPRAPFVAEGVMNRPLICNWCGRRGHVESSCWMKSGACLICGSNAHGKDRCPKYDSGWSGFKPSCSVCGGPHLGKDCDPSN